MRQKQRGGSSRSWCIPTAVTRDPDEAIEGDRILTELSGDLGVLLWRIARDVVLLAETPASKRASLFSPQASDKRFARLLSLDLPDDLAGPVDTVAAQLARPEKADSGIITWCCRLVAHWAAANRAPGTAIFFARAAALTSPEEAAPALDDGRIALTNGHRQPRTHCRRGHEFTPENTQWVNVRRVGGTAKGRLCRICSRARACRYLKSHPRKKASPLPPLPDEMIASEVELERYIRSVLRARAPQRAAQLWAEVESRLEDHGFQVTSGLHRVPIRVLARPDETFAEYAARTDARLEDYGDWFVCRMLDDPRIRAELRKARSRYTIIEAGKVVKPRVPTPRRRRNAARP